MAPSSTTSVEVLEDPLKQKFLEILKSHGITSEVDKITLTEPEELKGEHMAAATAYVRVEFKDASIPVKNLFVKRFTTNEAHTQFVKQMRIMEKESAFFNSFLPKAREFCQKYKGCENMLDFFPKCLYGDDDILVQENLVLDDTWVMLNKEEKQDLFTAKFVLTNLARFHGANYALIEEELGGRDKFRQDWEVVCAESFLGEKNPMMESFFDNGLNTCLNILKGFPVDGSEKAAESIEGFRGKTYPLVQTLLKPEDDLKMVVVNHGDCWNNNMLFKKDPSTGKVKDHVFVDMQITRFGSPCLDIGYFMYTSIKPEVRRAHRNELLQHYYDNLVETLQKFNMKCPLSYHEFYEDFKKHSRLGFFFNLNLIGAIGAFKDFDVDSMSPDPEEIVKQFNILIEKWMAANPEKAKDIAYEIVAVLKEEVQLQAS